MLITITLADGSTVEMIHAPSGSLYLPECWADARRDSYPPAADYLDAQVKKASADPDVRVAGQVQEADYLARCAAVKAAIPKE